MEVSLHIRKTIVPASDGNIRRSAVNFFPLFLNIANCSPKNIAYGINKEEKSRKHHQQSDEFAKRRLPFYPFPQGDPCETIDYYVLKDKYLILNYVA
jgi:hypothetical protein